MARYNPDCNRTVYLHYARDETGPVKNKVLCGQKKPIRNRVGGGQRKQGLSRQETKSDGDFVWSIR